MSSASTSKENDIKWITPTWSVPASIHAFTTTRSGGVSQAPFDSLIQLISVRLSCRNVS